MSAATGSDADQSLGLLALPARLAIAARIANMLVGLAAIPVLIHCLGGEGFASWALLLAASVGFATLDLGMAPTYVKHVAGPIQRGDWRAAGETLRGVGLILILAYLVCAWPVVALADELAGELRLRNAPALSAAAMIQFVYAAVAARAILQLGAHTLYAAMHFRAIAAASFLQPLCANLSACATAVATGRLDLTLIAYWSAQLIAVAVVCGFAHSRYLHRFLAAPVELATLRTLCAHGVRVQIYDWAQFVSFQFDKFLIAWLVGLWGVAPYEVANRSVLALRSVPSSAADTLLPFATISHQAGRGLWERYESMTRMTCQAIIVFMLAPLAVGPVFLYAWTGEMGYVGRWPFAALALGAAGGVLALPAAMIAQAIGRTQLQVRSAALSIFLNAYLSFVLVLNWEVLGAAIGTAVAMLASSALLISDVHRSQARPVAKTAAIVASYWPQLAVCLGVGALSYIAFAGWFASLDPATRFARHERLLPAFAAGAAYLACLALLRLLPASRRGPGLRGLLAPDPTETR